MPRVGIENEIYGKTTMNPSTRYLVALEKDYNFFSKKYHRGLISASKPAFVKYARQHFQSADNYSTKKYAHL